MVRNLDTTQEPSEAPPEAQALAKAMHAFNLAAMATATTEDRLVRLRGDRQADPGAVSDAAKAYRESEANMQRCVVHVVEAHKLGLQVVKDLTSQQQSTTMKQPQPPTEGAQDAHT